MSTISAGHAEPHGHAHEEPQIAARHELDVNKLTPGPGFGAMARNALWFVGVIGILKMCIRDRNCGACHY